MKTASAITFYVEATVVATGILMADSGLTAEQVERLRAAEARGIISGLIVEQDVDLASAFRNPFA